MNIAAIRLVFSGALLVGLVVLGWLDFRKPRSPENIAYKNCQFIPYRSDSGSTVFYCEANGSAVGVKVTIYTSRNSWCFRDHTSVESTFKALKQ